ncbi:MAG: PLD nuclease N-terminal domain-containing protein [Kineosporiaceae bacterium]
MFLLTRGLPLLLEIGLLVFCVVDCVQTPAEATRNLAKGWWLVLIVVMPLVGGIAWLVAGRPQRAAASGAPWPSTRTAGFPEYERPGRSRAPLAPDDDPEFLAQISRVDREQERTLGQWEADLLRREEELRRRGDERSPDAGGAGGMAGGSDADGDDDPGGSSGPSGAGPQR